MSFSEIRISNGVIVVEDGMRDRTETLERVELSLAWPSIAKRFAATGHVSWRDEPLDIGLTIADFPAALAGDVSGLKLRVAGAPVKLAFDGAMSYLPSIKIDGTLAADTVSLRNALRWVSGKPLPASGLGRLSLKARTNVVGGTIALSNLNIELDGNVAEGVLSYATRGRRTLQGTLAVDTLDLTPYTSALRLLAAGARVWDRKPIALDWFDAIDLDLRVSAARVIAGHSRLGRTAAAATLRNGQLTVTVGELQGFNGLINGSVAIAKTNTGAQLRSQLRLTNVDLETCLTELFGFRRLEGKGDLSLELDAEGRSVLALARTMNGSVTLAATQGALTGFNIEQLLRRLERRPLAGSADFRSGRTAFESLNIALRITQGTANLEEGRFVGANVRLALSGTGLHPRARIGHQRDGKPAQGRRGAAHFRIALLRAGKLGRPDHAAGHPGVDPTLGRRRAAARRRHRSARARGGAFGDRSIDGRPRDAGRANRCGHTDPDRAAALRARRLQPRDRRHAERMRRLAG